MSNSQLLTKSQSQLLTKSQSFELLKSTFMKTFNCILYFQDHRTQLWYHLVSIIKIYTDIKNHSIS